MKLYIIFQIELFTKVSACGRIVLSVAMPLI